MEPQPCVAQQVHMNNVMEVLGQGPQSLDLFGDAQPNDARDECILLLLERGASCLVPAACSRVVSSIVCELAKLARVPHLINEAVVGMAHARQQQPKPRDDA